MSFLPAILKKRAKTKYVLSVDVGTKVVKALISRVDYEEGTVTNLGVGKTEQEKGNIVGGEIADAKGVASACKRAIMEAEREAKLSAQDVVMGFSGSTIKICANTFEFVREDPHSKITVSELKNIVRDMHGRSVDEITRSLTFRERQSGIKLVSSDIVDFSIDGYRVINPLNFKGSRIKITISSSYVLAGDFAIIREIAGDLKLNLLKVAYGPYAVIRAIGAQDTLNFSAVMIDVGANITDVVLVKNGSIRKAGMFILGGQLFTKRLAGKLNISEDNAEDLKIKYSKKRFGAEETDEIEKMLTEDIELWLSGVQLILEEAGTKFLVPAKVLFYGGGSQLPGIVSSLRKLDSGNFSFADKLKLDFVRLEHIVGNVDQTGKLDNFQDLTLVGLAHLCLDGADSEDPVNSFLAEIV